MFRLLAAIVGLVVIYAITPNNGWVFPPSSLADIQSLLMDPTRLGWVAAWLLAVVDWKAVQFSWLIRCLFNFTVHLYIRPRPTYGPDALFRFVVCESYAALHETDQNLHKSNSTFFSDLDLARSHMLHLIKPGVRALQANSRTKLVLDPYSKAEDNKAAEAAPAANGRLTIALGGVQCSFKREVMPLQKYEMWTRVLDWDRKWLYIGTFFVEKKKKKGNRGERKIFATAVSKYVFKLGRLTVHPTVVLDASGLLPERPGGWIAAAEDNETFTEKKSSLSDNDTWDWRRVEKERFRTARRLTELDSLSEVFQDDEEGILRRFWPG